jgi:hypothetical protein
MPLARILDWDYLDRRTWPSRTRKPGLLEIPRSSAAILFGKQRLILREPYFVDVAGTRPMEIL